LGDMSVCGRAAARACCKAAGVSWLLEHMGALRKGEWMVAVAQGGQKQPIAGLAEQV